MFRKTLPLFLNGTLLIPARCLVKKSTVLHARSVPHFCHSNRRFFSANINGKPNGNSDDKEKEKEDVSNSTDANTQPQTAHQPQIDEKQIKEDRKLQQSYQSFFPRFFKALQLLIPTEQEKFDNLVRDKVILPSDFLVGSNLYIDLQHPLLLKYNFNPVDFNAGATEAFTQIRKAVSAMERHDELHCCKASTKLLKGALNGPLFSLYMKAFEVMGKPDTRTIMKDLKIKSVVMTSVGIDIVDDDFYESEEEMYKILYRRVGGGLIAMKRGRIGPIVTTPSGDNISEQEATIDGSKKELNEKVLEEWVKEIKVDRIYPHGSVVASVEVRFDSEETGVQIVGHGNEAKESDFLHKKSTILGFQACISGQVPLDWLVVRMHVQSLR